MNTHIMAAAGAIALFATAFAVSDNPAPVADNEMGLSKTSVFDDPSPDVFEYPKTEPSAAVLLPRSWDSAPPQIPHKIEAFLPIKTEKNLCVTCHEKPSLLGKPKVKGVPTAMPESHYDSVDGKLTRNNGRHFCVQCHTPQANVAELVGNTFKTDR